MRNRSLTPCIPPERLKFITMNFKELQNKIVQNALDYGKRYGIKIDEDFALLKLYEEVGELAQAVLIHRKMSRPEKHVSEEVSKKELAKELADVVGMAIVNAHLLGIDLEEAIDKKWINKKNKNPRFWARALVG